MKMIALQQVRPGPILIAQLLVCASIVGGCRRPESNAASSSVAADAASSPDYSVPVSAEPREVAEMALKAITADQLRGLQSLLASKKIQQDMQAITRGKNKFGGMVDNAVSLAASSIASEMNWLEPKSRVVEGESITGEKATVTVKGLRLGNPQTRQFFLVREDNAWKLVPSHR
ncbi:MAG: hypothetical protein KDA51_20890 [Planctomycetales bacterium]|nr:hypothetical protein [Planctomycetales bacterium]MCA9183938.1 hypothetical protein [Planctomycetales bacterium]